MQVKQAALYLAPLLLLSTLCVAEVVESEDGRTDSYPKLRINASPRCVACVGALGSLHANKVT